MPPLISILLPVWNAAATLPAGLRSLQRQTEQRWQCVLVDDGSDDGSLACARWFAVQDTRFTVVATSHQGLVATLHTGLAYCRGRFVARMDADDLMHRQRLSLQLRMLEESPHLTAVGCHVRLFPRHGLPEGRQAYERWLNSLDTPERVRQDAFVECPLAHPTLMLRREVLQTLGYRDCGWPEDYDLLLRLLTRGYEVGVVPQRLLSWRDTPGRLSRTSPTYALVAPREARNLGSGRKPMKWVVVTQWVRAEMAQVPSDESLASRSVVTSTCTPSNGRTELDGTKMQAA